MAEFEHAPLLDEQRSQRAYHGYTIDRKRGSFRKELYFLFKTTIPVMAAYMLQNSIQTATVVITGRLGPDELSAAAFAMMLATVTGWCIALGGTTALDTFGSQAYTFSNRNPTVIVPHLLRCIVILWVLLFPVLVLWFFISPVLLFLGQNERLSRDVQTFLRILTTGAPAYIGFESVKKYLQCQGIMHVSTSVLLVTSPLNALLSYLLIHKTSFGFMGAPIAISITYFLSFFLIVLYARYGPGPPPEPSESQEEPENITRDVSPASSSAHSTDSSSTAVQLFSDFPMSTITKDRSTPFTVRQILSPAALWSFTRLALPGILMVATEWWAFEIVALAAGRLGRLPLAAQGVVMTADQILNTLPFGLSVSASARIGNLIGSRKPFHAKLSAHTAAFLSVCLGATVMIVLLIEKEVDSKLFSVTISKSHGSWQVLCPLLLPFRQVYRSTSSMRNADGVNQVADGLANSCGGVLRGQGRQHLGAVFNLVAYYILALPFGLTLAFYFDRGMFAFDLEIDESVPYSFIGLQGLWIGQVVALFIVGFGEYIAVWRFTDWEEEVRKGIERIGV